MSLEQIVNDRIKDAMRQKDADALRGLRAIKSAILLAKTAEGASDTLSETEEIKILNKLVKQRQDALTMYESQNRTDLADKEKVEIVIIQEFLPKQLSETELRAEVQKIITQTGATSMKDMGKVMGAASKQLMGKADGGSISAMVKELLS
ncbi:MAG: GatB/YqeY domain-containing protein [Chitinophagales bacterium]|nr:GatB/YqeY domain-containing protein [Bacteroidota bacterium]